MDHDKDTIETVRRALGRRSLVLVGLMGCGKSSIGKRLAAKLGLPFVDADEEIERVAQKSITEIFSDRSGCAPSCTCSCAGSASGTRAPCSREMPRV
jgi:predicted ATPase with chaperone activity